MPPRDTDSENPFEAPAAAELPQHGFWSSWSWVPSLYFAEAVPYVLVMQVAGTFYADLGISNSQMARYTSLLYLPWVLKPLWSPMVDIVWTKRAWIVTMQLAIAVAIAAIASSCNQEQFFLLTLIGFWAMAIASATHDIAADGFYMIGLSPHQQSYLVGVRSVFYRFGSIAGNGLLVVLAGLLAESGMGKPVAWATAYYVAAGCFLFLAIYHAFVLPRQETKVAREDQPPFFAEVAETVASFFRKPGVWYGIAYILFYRFAEGQLTKIASPFLLDDRANGGLGLSVAANGTIYGTAGVAMLVVGGILGGIAVSRGGLGRWILWMALAINLPNLVYVWMAFVQPESLWLVALCVGIEQLGYGFGFAGYMLYMISLAQGKHQTAHYALCTGIMAAGMMLPGFISGDIQEALGYRWFLVWIMVSTIPSFIVTWLLPVDPNFGREEAGDAA